MPDGEDHPAVTRAQPLVDGPAERVLEDRYTDYQGVGGGGGGGTTAPAFPSPFPARLDAGFMEAPADHPLRKALIAMSKQKPFDKLTFAIADLSKDPKRPIYASPGGDRARRFASSIAKLPILLAALSLREAAREAARQVVAKSPEDLWKQLARAWGSAIRRHYIKGSTLNFNPKLGKILAATRDKPADPFTIDFAKPPPGTVDAAFYLDLELALVRSSNDSASACIRALGYPYIRGAVEAAGFAKGFFLNKDFIDLKYTWDTTYRGSGEEASVRAVAEFLALTVQERLPGGPGSVPDLVQVMWRSTNFPLTDTASLELSDLFGGLRQALAEQDRVTLTGHGKVGFLTNGPFHDSCILRRRADNERLTYVAVVFGADSHQEVRRAAVALDDCVLLGNGLPTKAAPSP